MIKAIIFDLDGVLVDTKKIHFEALNEALKKFDYKEINCMGICSDFIEKYKND